MRCHGGLWFSLGLTGSGTIGKNRGNVVLPDEVKPHTNAHSVWSKGSGKLVGIEREVRK